MASGAADSACRIPEKKRVRKTLFQGSGYAGGGASRDATAQASRRAIIDKLEIYTAHRTVLGGLRQAVGGSSMTDIVNYNEHMARAREATASVLGANGGQVGVAAGEFARSLYDLLLEWFDKEYERRLQFLENLRSSLNHAHWHWDEHSKAQAVAKLKKLSTSAKTAEVTWPFPDPSLSHLRKEQEAHDWPHDQSGLKSSALEYMTTLWGESLSVERILIAALAYSEANAFSMQVRTRRYGFLGEGPKPAEAALVKNAIWAGIKGLWWLGVGAVVGLLVADTHGAGAGLASALIFLALNEIRIRLAATDATKAEGNENKLLGDMFEICKATRFINFSPTAIRSAMEATSVQGAVWPAELWQLVLRAEDRCRWQV
jgi:hypothetical protein